MEAEDMGAKDTITKAYMQDEETFADAFNFAVFGGRQVVLPKKLRPLDTTLVALPSGDGETKVEVQRFRDVAKVMTAMVDGRAAYVLLGIENESVQKYTEPVKIMLYDALQYVNQIEETGRRHRREGRKPKDGAEFLSGFYEEDRLLPVITLTIHFDSEKWTATRNLHGMMLADEEILEHIPNYPIHLISSSEISNRDFEKFRSELGLTLKYIKYSKDKEKLMDAVQSDERFKETTRRTVDLINTVTGSKLVYPEGKEKVDMCQAIKELIADAEKAGEARMENKVKEAEDRALAAESKMQVAEDRAQAAEQEAMKTKRMFAKYLLSESGKSVEEIACETGLNVGAVKALC